MNHRPPRLDAAAITRLAPIAVLVASLGALGTAGIAQFGFGIEPCYLCQVQRVPFAVAGLLAAGLVVWRPGARTTGLVLAACAVVFLAGSAVAFYHVGVERHWWASVAGCGAGEVGLLTIEDLKAALAGSRPPKPCDEVDWTLLGLSMATYNVGFSLLLAAATGLAARRVAGR